jgi:hypothetical protein
MDIRNATQFSSYVSQHNLMGLDHTFKKIVDCIADYLRHCNCHRKADKDKIYGNCNNLYNAGARLAAIRFKHEFLNKTPERQIAFYSDSGSLIGIASR